MDKHRIGTCGERCPSDAAQRLLTTVTQQNQGPMTADPIGDARLILRQLDQRT